MNLVIVGGVGTTKEYYNRVKEEMLKSFNKVFVKCTRGDTLEELVEDLKEFLKQMNEPFVLMGHSFGGYVSTALLGDRYENVYLKGFVMCNSSYSFSHINLKQNYHETSDEYAQKYPFMKELQQYIDRKEQGKQMMIAINNPALEQFKNIDRSIPVTFIGSSNDGYVPKTFFMNMIGLFGMNREIRTYNWSILDGYKHLGLITNTDVYRKTIEFNLKILGVM